MKIVFLPLRLSALLLALAAALPSLAQTQLKEVVVTASRVATPITDVIADVSVIDRTVLDQAGQSSLREVLAQQPGIQMISNGSYRSQTGIFLRGAAASQTLVLIDGVRVGSATSGSVSYENMPLDRIERIEILRGAASALYGPDAVGGVIQIFTRNPSEQLELSAHLGAGSDGQAQAAASIRGRAGAIAYSLGLTREQATGISVSANPLSSGFNPDEDGFTSRSMDAKITATLSNEQGLSLGLLHSQTEYQFDGKPSPNPLALTKLTSDARAKPVLNQIHLKWDAQWTPQWSSSLMLGASDDESVSEYFRIPDGAFGGSTQFNTQRRQLGWQNDMTLGKDVLSFLLETRSEAVDSSTHYAVKERDVHSALLSYAMNRAQWNALAVLRNDENSQFGSFTNWALSGGYKLTQALRAVASVGTSFQAPSFNQLYFPGFGTPTLTPQQNRGGEIGLKYNQGALTMGAVAYYNEIQGYIVPATNVQSSLAVLRGATLSAEAQRGATRYAVSYDYADPRMQPSDQRLVRVAQNLLNLSVNHRLGALNLFGELRLSSDREDNNLAFTGRDVLAGYGLLNLGVDWKIRKDLSLLARINNATDTQYMLANGYTVPGRNFFVSASWRM